MESTLALPGPRVAALLVLAGLGSGIALGAAAGADRTAVAARRAPVVVVLAQAAAPAAAVQAPTAPAAPPAPPPTAAPPTPAPVAAMPAPAAPKPKEAAPTPAPAATDSKPATPTVRHVWVVTLPQLDSEEPFEASAPDPLLRDLAARGTRLSRYRTLGAGSLANAVALLGGLAPTAATEADCPRYEEACIAPATTPALPGALTGAGLRWRAYVDGIGTPCRRPEIGTDDPWREPRTDDAYVTHRNPFVYFHAIVDAPECGSDVVGLDALAPDLAAADPPPAFSYVVVGPAALAQVVDAITSSPAFTRAGLLVVIGDRGPRGRAGERAGALLLSPFATAGATVAANYTPLSILKSAARLLGAEPPGLAAGDDVLAFGPRVLAPQ